MRLYYSKGAASLAVRIMINEMNLPCEFEAVDLKSKITESGENLYDITSKGYVPALKIDENTVLTETAVILQYLVEHNRPATLSELGAINRYRILEWLNFIVSELHKSCAVLLNQNIPEQSKDSLFKSGLKLKLAIVNHHLSYHPYLVNDQFTIADAYLFTVLFWLPHFLKIELSSWKYINQYFLKLKNRQSVLAAFQDEAIEII